MSLRPSQRLHRGGDGGEGAARQEDARLREERSVREGRGSVVRGRGGRGGTVGEGGRGGTVGEGGLWERKRWGGGEGLWGRGDCGRERGGGGGEGLWGRGDCGRERGGDGGRTLLWLYN